MIDPEEVLNRKKKRAIAILLRFKETNCDQYLPENVSFELRKLILDQVNDLCNLAVDMMESSTDGIVVNEVYLDQVARIYEVVVENA